MPSIAKSDKKMARLFFAIDVPPRLKSQLELLQNKSPFQGRAVSPHNFHMTLLFIGAYPRNQLEQLIEAIASPQIKPFTVALTQFAFFPKAEVGCLEAAPEPRLDVLHQHLKSCLNRAGIPFKKSKKPFRPHITLYRDATVSSDLQQTTEQQLIIDHFQLLESKFTDKGVYYEMVEEWPLYQPTIKEQLFGLKDD